MGLAAGIGGLIASAIPALGTATILGTPLSTILGGALLGTGTSAAESAITGGNITPESLLLGAAGGGASPVLTTALTPTLGAATAPLVGAGIGAGTSALEGGNPLTGAITGGATGLISDALSGTNILGTTPSTATTADTGATPTTGGALTPGGTALTTTGVTGTPAAGAVGAGPSLAGGGAGGAAGTAAPASAAIDPANLGFDAFASGTPASNAAAIAAMPGASPSEFNTALNTSVAAAGGGGSGLSGFLSNLLGGSSSTGTPATSTMDSSITTEGGDFSGGASPQSASGSSLGSLLKNPGFLIGGGLLGLDLLMQPSTTNPSTTSTAEQTEAAALQGVGGALTAAGVPSLESQATQFSTQGTQLANYLQTGTLPPGVQASIDQAANQAKAQILSQYANMGGGAETSSAAQQALANVDMTAQSQGANIALSLLQQGVSEESLATNIYNTLLSSGLTSTAESAQLYGGLTTQALQEDQALGNAIASFASAMVPRTVTTATTV